MGRLPCCDKGVKKGPWTPEEDIILVSYIQQHGPGNWRAVPTNTGLSRCSKSCRLRWINYLRPGIKRGNFTKQEEKIIIHLQALLGNRWAAIASYFPERTDNDIKNYWNTNLKNRLQKLESGSKRSLENNVYNSASKPIPRGQLEIRLQTDINMAKKALTQALSPNDNSIIISNDIGSIKQTTPNSICYASNADNIARLLKGWMKNPSKSNSIVSTKNSFNNLVGIDNDSSEGTLSVGAKERVELNETFESLFDYESLDYSSNSDFSPTLSSHEASSTTSIAEMPFSLLEKWLLDDTKIGVDANLF